MPEPLDEFDRSLRDRIGAAEARVRVSSTAPAGGAAALGQSRWVRPVLVAATAAVAVVLAVLVIGQLPDPSVGDATPSPSAVQSSLTPSPVSASARDGDFVLTLSSPRSLWTTQDAIEITATLNYDGDEPEVEIGGACGPIVFDLRQVSGGNAAMGYAQCEPYISYPLGPDTPLVRPFEKSGELREEPPFDRAFFEDPELHLPPGRWSATAILEFDYPQGSGFRTLQVSIEFEVVQPAAAPSGGASTSPEPTPATPSESPTETQSIEPTGYVLFVQNEDAETYRVELIEVESSGDQIYHPWTIGPDHAALVEVPSTLPGYLQVREVDCGAIASWDVDPGRYRVIIRDGAASLVPSETPPSAAPLPTASTCIFSGP
jgi:hypothetical protein